MDEENTQNKLTPEEEQLLREFEEERRKAKEAMEKNVREEIKSELAEEVKELMERQTGDAIEKEVKEKIEQEAREKIEKELREKLEDELKEKLKKELEEKIKKEIIEKEKQKREEILKKIMAFKQIEEEELKEKVRQEVQQEEERKKQELMQQLKELKMQEEEKKKMMEEELKEKIKEQLKNEIEAERAKKKQELLAKLEKVKQESAQFAQKLTGANLNMEEITSILNLFNEAQEILMVLLTGRLDEKDVYNIFLKTAFSSSKKYYDILGKVFTDKNGKMLEKGKINIQQILNNYGVLKETVEIKNKKLLLALRDILDERLIAIELATSLDIKNSILSDFFQRLDKLVKFSKYKKEIVDIFIKQVIPDTTLKPGE